MPIGEIIESLRVSDQEIDWSEITEISFAEMLDVYDVILNALEEFPTENYAMMENLMNFDYNIVSAGKFKAGDDFSSPKFVPIMQKLSCLRSTKSPRLAMSNIGAVARIISDTAAQDEQQKPVIKSQIYALLETSFVSNNMDASISFLSCVRKIDEEVSDSVKAATIAHLNRVCRYPTVTFPDCHFTAFEEFINIDDSAEILQNLDVIDSFRLLPDFVGYDLDLLKANVHKHLSERKGTLLQLVEELSRVAPDKVLAALDQVKDFIQLDGNNPKLAEVIHRIANRDIITAMKIAQESASTNSDNGAAADEKLWRPFVMEVGRTTGTFNIIKGRDLYFVVRNLAPYLNDEDWELLLEQRQFISARPEAFLAIPKKQLVDIGEALLFAAQKHPEKQPVIKQKMMQLLNEAQNPAAPEQSLGYLTGSKGIESLQKFFSSMVKIDEEISAKATEVLVAHLQKIAGSYPSTFIQNFASFSTGIEPSFLENFLENLDVRLAFQIVDEVSEENRGIIKRRVADYAQTEGAVKMFTQILQLADSNSFLSNLEFFIDVLEVDTSSREFANFRSQFSATTDRVRFLREAFFMNSDASHAADQDLEVPFEVELDEEVVEVKKIRDLIFVINYFPRFVTMENLRQNPTFINQRFEIFLNMPHEDFVEEAEFLLEIAQQDEVKKAMIKARLLDILNIAKERADEEGEESFYTILGVSDEEDASNIVQNFIRTISKIDEEISLKAREVIVDHLRYVSAKNVNIFITDFKMLSQVLDEETCNNFLKDLETTAIFPIVEVLQGKQLEIARNKIADYCKKYSGGLILNMALQRDAEPEQVIRYSSHLSGILEFHYNDEYLAEVIDHFERVGKFEGQDDEGNNFINILLAANSDHSAMGKIALRTPIEIKLSGSQTENILLRKTGDVIFFLKFFPFLITEEVMQQLAQELAVIETINKTLRFYNASYINSETFKLFKEINKFAPATAKIALEEVTSFKDLSAIKAQFKIVRGKAPIPEIADWSVYQLICDKENLTFGNFYEFLSSKEREELSLFVLSDEESKKITEWLASTENFLRQEIAAIPPVEISKAISGTQEEKELIKRRQNLRNLLNDLIDIPLDLPNSFVKMRAFMAEKQKELPAEISAIDPTQMQHLQHTSEVEKNWSKFANSSKTFAEVGKFCVSLPEYRHQILKALALITQPNCDANLSIISNADLDSKKYANPDHAIFATSLFKATMPFLNSQEEVIRSARNVEQAIRQNESQMIYFANNAFYHLLGEEIEKADPTGKMQSTEQRIKEGKALYERVLRSIQPSSSVRDVDAEPADRDWEIVTLFH